MDTGDGNEGMKMGVEVRVEKDFEEATEMEMELGVEMEVASKVEM